MFYISSASHFRKSFDWATDILSGAGWVPHNNIFVQSDERKFPGRSGRGQKTKRDLNRELKEFEEVDNKRSSSGGIGACDDGKDYCEDPRGNEIISFQWKKFFWSFLVWRLVLALNKTGILTYWAQHNAKEAIQMNPCWLFKNFFVVKAQFLWTINTNWDYTILALSKSLVIRWVQMYRNLALPNI